MEKMVQPIKNRPKQTKMSRKRPKLSPRRPEWPLRRPKLSSSRPELSLSRPEWSFSRPDVSGRRPKNQLLGRICDSLGLLSDHSGRLRGHPGLLSDHSGRLSCNPGLLSDSLGLLHYNFKKSYKNFLERRLFPGLVPFSAWYLFLPLLNHRIMEEFHQFKKDNPQLVTKALREETEE